jgi:hypothetical protein
MIRLAELPIKKVRPGHKEKLVDINNEQKAVFVKQISSSPLKAIHTHQFYLQIFIAILNLYEFYASCP